MKKILFLVIGLSFLACKKEKDEFTILKDSIEPLDLPKNIVGKWRWISSFDGWVSRTSDSTNQKRLIVNADKTYQSCDNQNCQTSEWVYGFRELNDRGKIIRDTLLVFNAPALLMNARQIEQLKDTLFLGSFCDDCPNHIYVREK